MNIFFKKTQSTIVYVMLIVLVVGSLLMIALYLKRSVQGSYHQSADVFGGGAQYQPGRTTINEQ